MRQTFAITAFLLCLTLPGGLWANPFQKGLEKLEGKTSPLQKKIPATEALPATSPPLPATADWETHQTKAGFHIQLPGGWTVLQDDSQSFTAHNTSKPGVAVTVMVNDYGPDFPVASSMEGYRMTATQEADQGLIESKEDVRLGKAEAILRLEKAGDPDEPRRITIQGYAGSIALNVVASAPGKHFEEYRTVLDRISRSIRF